MMETERLILRRWRDSDAMWAVEPKGTGDAMRRVVVPCIEITGGSLLWGGYFPDNPASGRVMEKCGFSHIGQ